MRTSQAGLDLIKSFEGWRSEAYVCPAGVLTIGYGTTKNVVRGMTITKEEGEALLREDVERFESAVDRLVTVPLEQHQFDALVSFTYNLGEGALGQSTLLRLLNAGNYEAVGPQFDRWVKAGNKTLPGLVRRRAAERRLFEGD